MSKFQIVNLLTLLVMIGSLTIPIPISPIYVIIVAVVINIGLLICGVMWIQMQYFGKVILRGGKDRLEIALTFDDGPDPKSTPKVLQFLKEKKIKATFFCIGKKVEKNPGLTQQILREGHLIGNHSYHHSLTNNFLIGASLVRELKTANEAIKKVTGETPTFYRPPVGLMNPHVHKALKLTNLKAVGWGFRTLDRNSKVPESVALKIIHKTKNGTILLFHDGNIDTAPLIEILEQSLATLRKNGFSFKRLDEIL